MKETILKFTSAMGATHVAKFANQRKAAFTLAEGATHVASSDNQRRVAFTLAEVLITLGIIGVVAALTLPSFIQNYRIMQLETAFKKTDAMMQEALKRSLFELGYTDISQLHIINGNRGQYASADRELLRQEVTQLNDVFLKQFNNVKSDSVQYADCSRGIIAMMYDFFGEGRCWNNGYIHFGGYILSNGVETSGITYWENGFSTAGFSILFDTNTRYKGPNRRGHDIFEIKYPEYYVYCNPNIVHSSNIEGCYFFARANKSPLNSNEPYWNLLFTPRSYWTNYGK